MGTCASGHAADVKRANPQQCATTACAPVTCRCRPAGGLEGVRSSNPEDDTAGWCQAFAAISYEGPAHGVAPNLGPLRLESHAKVVNRTVSSGAAVLIVFSISHHIGLTKIALLK